MGNTSRALEQITWEHPADEKLTWHADLVHYPEPATTMQLALYAIVTQGIARARRTVGDDARDRMMVWNGRPYVSYEPLTDRPLEERRSLFAQWSRSVPGRWESEWLPELKADLERLNRIELTSLGDASLGAVLQDALVVTTRHWEIHFEVVFGLGGIDHLLEWYHRRYEGATKAESLRLISGLENLSVTGGHRLWRLSQMVTPSIAAALRAGERESLPDEFRAELEAYLDEFGERPDGVVDPSSPTWREEPGPVVDVLLRLAEQGAADPYLELQRSADEREALLARIRAELSDEELTEFEGMLAHAHALTTLREDHAYWIDQRSIASLRRILAECGRRMARSDVLDREEDLRWLHFHEVQNWAWGLAQPGLREVVAGRRAQWEADREKPIVPTIGAPPEEGGGAEELRVEEVPEAEEHPIVAKGVGACLGAVRGRARVALTLEEAGALRKGEVLVCQATVPNWTPLFGLAAALVTDLGGVLSHAAIVAREYRLPTVVGTRTGTRTIRTGQLIEVDGGKGTVRLVEESVSLPPVAGLEP
jgi:rifampicin phosphotransferase